MALILPATEYDVAEIHALIEKYFPYTEMMARTVLARTMHPRFLVEKTLENEELTGYAEWQIVNPTEKILRLNGIAVKPTFQGKGHAKKLLLSGETWARKKGMKKLTLFVSSKNTAAQKLYEKNGWVKSKEHTEKINREPAEIWEKEL